LRRNPAGARRVSRSRSARTTIALALAAATALALPPGAAAKGIAGAALCGPGACHPVATRAVRTGFESFTAAPAPARAEPYLTLRLRARIAGDRTAVVATSAWLPRANLVRGAGQRAWTRPAPALARALRRAARGLRRHPSAGLGDVSAAPPPARVVEDVAPGRDEPERDGPSAAVLALLAAAAAAAAALAHRARVRSRAPGRPPASLRTDGR
jgi:hypothetical protein